MRIVLVLLACVWLVDGVVQARSVSPEVHVSQTEESSWTLEHEIEACRVQARLGDGAEVALEIDYDGPADDESFVGITPILGTRRLEGRFWGSIAPFIYPQLDPEQHQVERLEVRAVGDVLRVQFVGGSYRILSPDGPAEPLFMEALIRRRGRQLVVTLYGLYYLLPSQAGTRLDLTTAGELVSRVVEPGDEEASRVLDGSTVLVEVRDDESRHLEYFDRVTRVEIDDARFGRMEVVTFVDRLQIQVNRQPEVAIELFELDFDHTFKDRGQRRVMSRLSIELP